MLAFGNTQLKSAVAHEPLITRRTCERSRPHSVRPATERTTASPMCRSAAIRGPNLGPLSVVAGERNRDLVRSSVRRSRSHRHGLVRSVTMSCRVRSRRR